VPENFQPLPTPKYKYWRQTGVQSKYSCAAWPRIKQLHGFTHGHLPEPVLSIRTCFYKHEFKSVCKYMS
jgi:hypothetical protein